MPGEWVALITRAARPIGQRLLRKWLFEAELIEAKSVVYTSERGENPFVDILAFVRVHNRNHSPTTLYCERITVKFRDGTEDSFPPATGDASGTMPTHGEKMIQLGGSSTLEVRFYSRKPQRTLPSPYLDGSPLELTITLAETFGSRREITGELNSRNIVRK